MPETRVLHVVATGKRRGAELFAADLIRALDELGVEERVVVMDASGAREVTFGPHAEELDVMTGSSSRVSLVKSVRLRRLVLQWRPDVIQAHGGEVLTAIVLARLGIPVVYRRIGGAPRRLSSGWPRLAFQLVISRTARVVAVAHAVRRESMALYRIPPGRIVTIPNAVDPERLAATTDPAVMRKELDIDDAAPVLLSIAALSWEKDPVALLRVGADVLRRIPDAVHVFLGDGPMRPRLEQEASSLGLDGRVRILGSRADAPDFLALADVLLSASRPDGMEGMPAVLIEAGMLGTPSVAYDVAGVSEVLIDGQTGRLVPWGHEAALSDAVVELLKDDGIRDEMGRAARERCAEEFSIARIAPQYLELYREVVAG